MISSGEKIQTEVDYQGISGLNYTRFYRGKYGKFFTSPAPAIVDLSGTATRSSQSGCEPGMYKRPPSNALTPYCFPYAAINSQEYVLRDAMNRYIKFNGAASAPSTSPDVSDRLLQVSDNSGNKIWHAKRKNNTLEIYSSSTGLLLQRATPEGKIFQFEYDSRGRPLKMTDVFGRYLEWKHNADGRVIQFTDPAGAVYDYGYDTQGNLISVTYPPNPNGHRPKKIYHYESSYVDYYQGTLASLTGITNESGHRFSTYTYNKTGQVIATQHHLADGAAVNRVTLSGYPNSIANLRVTDPIGTTRTYNFIRINNYHVLNSVIQPKVGSTGTQSSNYSYDSQRNLVSRTDFNGNTVCYAYDLSRNLEIVRIEGNTTCPTNVAGYIPTGIQRKISTQWHPDWRLKTRIAEPGRITTYVYNGLPDPTAGNAIASCAPADALVDGKPIAVVCKQVEQATSDETGGAGFGAAAVGSARIQRWTYNRWGQVLTANGPRTDNPGGKDDITTYEYYADTQTDWTMGDLKQVTNALGHITRYPKYDRNGRLLQQIDPNGTVTEYAYTPRGWLTQVKVTAAGSATSQSTVYEYDAVGQMTQATQPDGSFTRYTYDAAQRLTEVTDSAGNRVSYTLDAMGNRTREEWKDPSGALRK